MTSTEFLLCAGLRILHEWHYGGAVITPILKMRNNLFLQMISVYTYHINWSRETGIHTGLNVYVFYFASVIQLLRLGSSGRWQGKLSLCHWEPEERSPNVFIMDWKFIFIILIGPNIHHFLITITMLTLLAHWEIKKQN